MLKICKFCNLENFEKNVLYSKYEEDCNYDLVKDVSDSNWSGLDMGYRSTDKQFLLIAYGDDRCLTDINFCPFCGRDLRPSKRCDAYHIEHGVPVCWGTKERDTCSCNGYESRCNLC